MITQIAHQLNAGSELAVSSVGGWTGPRGAQSTPCTGRAATCYIGSKSKGPVLENTIEPEVAAPTVKRGFVMPKFSGQVQSRALFYAVTGGMGLSVRTLARLVPCFQHPVHPMRLKTQLVVSLIQPGTKPMTVSHSDIYAANLAPSASAPDPIALHIKAMNCLSICRALLTANEPMYLFALNHLATAQQAIEALRTHEISQEG